MRKYVFALLVGIVFTSTSKSAIAQTISSSVADGGSVITNLGYNIKVNDGSSLSRSWITLNDTDCPVQIENAGISTRYLEDYWFDGNGSLSSSVPITAFNVRYVLYDIFGHHIKTLSDKEVVDVAVGEKISLSKSRWRAWESEVSELLTVVAFVAQVRTADGKVWRYDEDAIAEELLKIQIQTTTEDFEPEGEEG